MSRQKVHRYVPVGYEEPTTVLEALKVGRQLLSDEKRWTTHAAYKILHPEVDPSTPFCDDWMVCSIGALSVALIGLVPEEAPECKCCNDTAPPWTEASSSAYEDYDEWERRHRLYDRARDALSIETRKLGYSDIVQYNDHSSKNYSDVMSVWDAAIAEQELAELAKNAS